MTDTWAPVMRNVPLRSSELPQLEEWSKKWQIKEAVGGTHYVRAEASDATLTIGQAYNVLIEVSDNTATLKVGGVTKTSHTFASGIHGGKVGLYVYNAHAHFKEVAIKVPVNVTKYYTFGGQRVAMRKDNVVYFLLGDHVRSENAWDDERGGRRRQQQGGGEPALSLWHGAVDLAGSLFSESDQSRFRTGYA